MFSRPYLERHATLFTGVQNVHTVYVHGLPLGVECSRCGHRAFAYDGKVDDLKGNMREASLAAVHLLEMRFARLAALRRR